MGSLGRFALAALASALALGAHAGAEDPVDGETLPLWEAARDGLVTVDASSSQGYRSASLVVTNRTKRTLLLDVNASMLAANEEEQDLVMGILAAGKTDTSVTVPPLGEARGTVLTCCMSPGRPDPANGAGYKLALHAPPPDVARLASWWKEKPTVEQGRIQTAVWNHGMNPPADLEPQGPGPDDVVDLPDDTKRVAVADGLVSVLRASGDLMRAHRDERFETVATQVADMADDGATLHLVTSERAVRALRHDSKELATELAKLDAGDELLWAREGVALVKGEHGLSFVTPTGRKTIGSKNDRFMRAEGGAFVLAATGESVLKVHASTAEVLPLPFAASAFAPAPGGAYALDEKGVLFRFGAGDRPARAQHLLLGAEDALTQKTGTVARVGRSLRAIPGGLLVETDMDTVLVRPEKPPLHLAPLPEGATLVVDGVTGDLYSTSGHVLRRHDAERTGWVRVRFHKARAS
jgi:hypothetical protein